MKQITVLLLGLLMIAPAIAEKRYVTDQLWLQMRSGPGNEFRILKALKSGTHLELLEEDEESKYSKVRTDKGLEGWVLTRFLLTDPISFEKLILTNRELDKNKADLADLQSKHAELKKELATIKRQNNNLSGSESKMQKELDYVKKVSANAINLDKKNQELMERTESMKISMDTMKAENDRLRNSQDLNYLIAGGGLVFLGLFLGWLLPKLSGKRSDGWS